MVEIIPQEKRSSRKQPAERVIAKSTIKNEHLRQLEAKLLKVKNHRRKLVAELETINRELQNANRELVAANEELQSTNEELQSVNEELYTVNHELQLKNENLTSVNNDISNLLRSTEIGTIFLDKQLNIRRFTPAIRQQFKLLESDIGRPITHFSSAFENLDIGAASREVYKTLSPYEVEVKDREGFSYLMRILPYRTERDEVQGLVINFVDIHELINAQQEIVQLAHKFEAIFRHSKDIIMTMEMDGSLRMLNKSVGALKSNELSGKNLYDVLSPADAKLLKKAVKELYSKKIPQEVKIAFSAMPGTVVHYNVSVIAVMKEKKKSSSILSVMLRWQDVSEQVQEALEIDNAIREYQAFMDNTPYQIMLLERNGTVKYINYIRFNDLTKDAIIGKSVYSFANDFQKEQVKKVLDQVFSGASAEKISYEVETHNGAVVPIELVATPVVINGQISYAAVIIQPEGE
jgi:two-component system CheB/CheR fusion protein